MAQPVGAIISGAMQGALSTNLQGALGRAGWRWAFLINGVCTIFIALIGFILLPGYPERPNPLARFYLKDRHIDIALARARRVGRKPQVGITPKSFVRAAKSWVFWTVAIAWPIGTNTVPSNYFNLWLKSLKNPDGTAKYTVALLNYLPIVGQAAQLVFQVLVCGFSDYLGVRLPFLMFHSAISITSLAILIVRPSSQHTYMAGWYLNYLGAASMLLLCSWAATHLQDKPEVRTILFASGTLLAYLLSAFVPIAAYPASEAPNWHIGAKVYLGFAVLSTFMFIGISAGFRWQAKKNAKKTEGNTYE
ncbi:hypothetical protein Plec18167_002111 [Paecilomyces lecythidis]|uniref:Uncharacterized protein n=1 Tax=Paecilomyces lecythidis TaxID=3004212 RepID=A0ABR3Y886_9EURO